MIALPAGHLTEKVGQYVSEQTGATFTPGMFHAFMIINDKKDFVAGIVFNNYRGTDVEISCAAEPGTPAWRPSVCRAVFAYVFEQLGCVRCTSVTVKGNRKARSFLEALGFQLEGNLRLGYDGRRDALIYGLLRSECRFLDGGEKDPDGQEKRSSTAPSARPDEDGAGPGSGEYDGGGNAGEPEQDRPSYAAG